MDERGLEASAAAKVAEREAARADARIGVPFDRLERISSLRARLGEIDAELVLIGDTFGRYDLDDSAFEILTVPIAAFPKVAIEDDPGDTRYLADYLGVPMEDFPPVLLLGDCWLDGRHRVAAARAQGIETIGAHRPQRPGRHRRTSAGPASLEPRGTDLQPGDTRSGIMER